MFDFAEDDNLWREDLFAILGVEPDCDNTVMKKAYRKLSKKYHPDRYPLDSPEQKEALEIFSKITKAYDVLSDEIKKQNYLDTRRLLAEHLDSPSEMPTKPPPEKKKKDEPSSAEKLKSRQAEEAYGKGVKLLRQTKIDDAIDAFNEATSLMPKIAKYHSNLGLAYKARGWEGMAQASFKQALDIAPNDATALSNFKEPKKEKKSFFASLFGRKK